LALLRRAALTGTFLDDETAFESGVDMSGSWFGRASKDLRGSEG
jgi:hypothetical protein